MLILNGFDDIRIWEADSAIESIEKYIKSSKTRFESSGRHRKFGIRRGLSTNLTAKSFVISGCGSQQAFQIAGDRTTYS
jgi:hypothetical protein